MSSSPAPAPLRVLLAAPRGFCAGVERAVKIVEKAIERYGAPVYVRHEIVHNAHVVNQLRDKGAVFVDQLDEIPDSSRPVVFSAHGVAKSVLKEAERRHMFFIDAICPLVSKVHFEAEHLHRFGFHILLIGHRKHPEVIGVLGQLPPGAVSLIETEGDARNFSPPNRKPLAYITQTTLSVDDARDIVEALKKRFPDIKAPQKNDICYATSNRQEAVKKIAPHCDLMIVMGAENSSNSRRLVEVAQRYGCPDARLIPSADRFPWPCLGDDIRTVGLTAGASAPEILVRETLDALAQRRPIEIEEIEAQKEDVTFNLPPIFRHDIFRHDGHRKSVGNQEVKEKPSSSAS